MKGIIIFYINLPDLTNAVQSVDMVMKINKDIVDKLQRENDFVVMVVPTTGEACRAEKLLF